MIRNLPTDTNGMRQEELSNGEKNNKFIIKIDFYKNNEMVINTLLFVILI